MHQATRAGNVEIAKAILPIDICSHRRCALPQPRAENLLHGRFLICYIENSESATLEIRNLLHWKSRTCLPATSLWLLLIAFAAGSFGV